MFEHKGPVAVHFGAGNIGRGFIGALLQDAGYFVVFADVNQHLIDAMRKDGSYNLTELSDQPVNKTYDNYLALNVVTQVEDVVAWIAQAEIVTASVGAVILPRIAPTIQAGLESRTRPEKLVVMACENALRASDTIRSSMSDLDLADQKAIFCNTAVDRIVPFQDADSEPDVSVEPFSEWVIDSAPLGERKLNLGGAVLVPNLDPYIERKLYTVNTAHLSVAFLGQRAGHSTIVEALHDPEVLSQTEAVLAETSAVLIAKHGLDPVEHKKYVAKTLTRIMNPAVDDEIIRVGRDPIRKLSRFERLVGPAAYFAEHLGAPSALLRVIESALWFEAEQDPEVARLKLLLTTCNPEEFAVEVCGISATHPLSKPLTDVIRVYQSSPTHQQLLG